MTTEILPVIFKIVDDSRGSGPKEGSMQFNLCLKKLIKVGSKFS